MTPAELAELAELILHGDPDEAVAAMMAGRWRPEHRGGGRVVAVIPLDQAATP